MESAWIQGLIGGFFIGLAAAGWMLVSGRIAGMSGLMAQAFRVPVSAAGREAGVFLLGAALGPVLLALAWEPTSVVVTENVVTLLGGGLIVGLGVSLSNGCTSGHGVCGLSRLSPRSAVATVTFMASTAVTVFLIRHVLEVAP